MLADIDQVEWSLDDEEGSKPDEPNVIVDPTIEAFCVMRSRHARGTSPPPSSGRVPLEVIVAYMLRHANDNDDDE